jgi:prevent-host-death family protein
MIEVGVNEAKARFSELLEKVHQGERVLITRHGMAVGLLSPVSGGTRKDREATIARIRERRTAFRLGCPVRELRDEGHRCR